MTVQGYREIVGDAKFFAFAKALQRRFAYGNISTKQFIALAKQWSGLRGERLTLLDQYFQQWLYGTTRPTILPESFGAAAPPLARSALPTARTGCAEGVRCSS
jgi:aminopeptidase N